MGQSANRLGPAAAWVEHRNVEIYDHHNAEETDRQEDGGMKCNSRHLANVGSATTMVVEELRELMEKQTPPMRLREAEATLFSLGIRWDTGNLIYPSTTTRDVQALL